MTLATEYPHLEAFGGSQGVTLDRLSLPLTDPDEMFNLAGCCWAVKQGFPRQPNAADPYSYLKTIDEFLRLFPSAADKKLWRKLNQGTKVSEFLDTISELGIAIYYKGQPGFSVEIEKAFQVGVKGSKDADLFLTNSTASCWIDVKSIQPEKQNLSKHASHPVYTGEGVRQLFRSRIRDKFESKFEDAIKKNQLNPPLAGIALCLLKCEDLLASLPEVLVLKQMITLGPNLWTECPNLGMGEVYTLRKNSADDFLRPAPFCREFRPSTP